MFLIALLSFSSNSLIVCKYVFIVVLISECPNLFETDSMFTPLYKRTEACVWRKPCMLSGLSIPSSFNLTRNCFVTAFCETGPFLILKKIKLLGLSIPMSLISCSWLLLYFFRIDSVLLSIGIFLIDYEFFVGPNLFNL